MRAHELPCHVTCLRQWNLGGSDVSLWGRNLNSLKCAAPHILKVHYWHIPNTSWQVRWVLEEGQRAPTNPRWTQRNKLCFCIVTLKHWDLGNCYSVIISFTLTAYTCHQAYRELGLRTGAPKTQNSGSLPNILTVCFCKTGILQFAFYRNYLKNLYVSVSFSYPPEPFDGGVWLRSKQIPWAVSGALSHWKMPTKQDLLIGKVILGRVTVEWRTDPLIQRGFTLVLSASYLMGLVGCFLSGRD